MYANLADLTLVWGLLKLLGGLVAFRLVGYKSLDLGQIALRKRNTCDWSFNLFRIQTDELELMNLNLKYIATLATPPFELMGRQSVDLLFRQKQSNQKADAKRIINTNYNYSTDLQALYLSGTYCHRTSTRPPRCITPRQPTMYLDVLCLIPLVLEEKCIWLLAWNHWNDMERRRKKKTCLESSDDERCDINMQQHSYV